MRPTHVGETEEYIAMIGNLGSLRLMCEDLSSPAAEKPHSFGIAGGTIPRALSVKNIRSSANGIKGTAGGVNQKPVLCGPFDTSHNFSVQEIFADQPAC